MQASVALPPRVTPVHPRLYRRYFTPRECDWLDRFSDEDGSSEINLLRVLLARLRAAAAEHRSRGWSHQVVLLTAFSAIALNLAALTRLKLAAAAKAPDPALEVWAAADLEDL